MKISIAQALLLLIEYHQKEKQEIIEGAGQLYYDTIYSKLVSFYVNGPINPSEKIELFEILENFNDSILYHYTYPAIDEDASQLINNDPTKRYFETHLAFETMKRGIDLINRYVLEEYKGLLENLYKKDIADYKVSSCVLDGIIPRDINEKTDRQNYLFFHEYADCISRIKNKEIFTDKQGFSQEQRDKLLLIVQCSALGVLCATSDIVNPVLPMDIYGSGPFQSENRGKVLKGEHAKNPKESEDFVYYMQVSSHHHGLMKSHMPLPQDDEAMSTRPYFYLKPSEQASFNSSAPWPIFSFSRLVHPFSNAVSGTALCQLRLLAKLQLDGEWSFTMNEHEFKDFYRVYASTLLFFSGGHSLLEFISLLQLPKVVSEFSDQGKGGDYLKLSEATILNLFQPGSDNPGYKKIKLAFNIALHKTIEYNHLYLQKCVLNEKIEALGQDIEAIYKRLTHVESTVSHEPILVDDVEDDIAEESKMDVDETDSPADNVENNSSSQMNSSSDETDAVKESKKRKREDENDVESFKKSKVEIGSSIFAKKNEPVKKEPEKLDPDQHKKYKK